MICIKDAQLFVPYGRTVYENHPSNSNRTKSDADSSNIIAGSADIDFRLETWHVRKRLFEEELYINDKIVVWSEGENFSKRTLLSTYSFDNPIAKAFWCSFKKDIPEKTVSRCVGVLDNQRILHAYDEDGCNFSVTIPFPVADMWPMEDGGLIVQRELASSLPNYSCDSTTTLPYFFSLTHPLDEVVPMLCKSRSSKSDYIRDVSRFQIIRLLKDTKMVFVYDGVLKANMLFRINPIDQPSSAVTQSVTRTTRSSSPLTSKDKDSLPCSSKHLSSPSRLSTSPHTPSRSNVPSQLISSQSSQSPMTRRSRSPAAVVHSSLCEMDNVQCECAVESLMPQFCFEFTWSEASRIYFANQRDVMFRILEDNKSSKAFLCETIFAERFMCYLVPSKNQLRLLKVVLSNKVLTVVGGMSTIIAKDAVYVEACKMLIVLGADNVLCVYSGQEKIGRVHLLHPELNVYVTGTPNRGSKASFCPEGDISSVEVEETNLFALPRTATDVSLSDIPQDSSSLESFGAPVYLALREGVGKRFYIEISSGILLQATLPSLASSSVVRGCLRCILEAMPGYVYREFIVNYYHAANSIGALRDDEWSYFMMSFLTNVGFNTGFLKSLESICSSESLNISLESKRVRQSSGGDDEDWKFLLKSEVNRAFRNYLPDVFSHLGLDEELAFVQPCENIPSLIELHPCQNFIPLLPSIFLSLCVYHEDLVFNKYLIEERIELAKLLYIISRCLNFSDGIDYFEGIVAAHSDRTSLTEFNRPVSSIEDLVIYPDGFQTTEFQFLRWFYNVLSGSPYEKVFHFSPSQHKYIYIIVKSFAIFWPPEIRRRLLFDSTTHEIRGNSFIAQEIFQLINEDCSNSRRFHVILEGINEIFIEKCPRMFTLPIFDALIHAAEHYSEVKPEFFQLIGRHDLVYLQSNERNRLRLFSNEKCVFVNGANDGMEHLMSEHNEWIWKIWPLDLRIREVRSCLQSSEAVVVDIKRRQNSSDQEFTLEQEQKLLQLCSRTMSLAIGRGMFTLHTMTMLPTDEINVPLLNLKGQVPPRNTIIDMIHIEVPNNMSHWPEFHNGVAAALAIHPLTKGLGNAWFRANVPRNGNKTPDVAGIILGLGLCGRLADLPAFTVHDLFSTSNEITRIAMLLGIGASRHHSKDLWCTRLMTIHVKSMLQPTQIDLEIPFLEQMAAIMSLGLLYAESFDHRIGNTLIREIGNLPSIDGEREIIISEREAHSMTAGLAFGMVFLSRGTTNVLLTEWENSLVVTLHDYITGGRRDERYTRVRGQIREGDRYNQLVTGGPASIALGLMFFNSGMTTIAAIFEKVFQGGTAHPDVLFYYILGRCLVMWSEITPSIAWVESNVPRKVIDDVIDSQNYFVAVAASCFSLGLKYAGVCCSDASKVIMSFLSHFINMRLDLESYRITRSSILNSFDFCIGTLLISEAMIMAGSGNIPMLRLVRHLRTLPNIQYFLQMAMHVSLGLVFLGGGRLSLRNNNPFAIACLIASLVPCFPISSNDNHFHPQFLRHLYVLACEPRLLSFRIEAENMHLIPAKVNVKIALKNGKSFHVENKCAVRLPPIDLIKSLKITSAYTWPIYFEMPKHLTDLRKILEGDGLILMQYKGFSSDKMVDNKDNDNSPSVPILPTIVDRINKELRYYFSEFRRPVDINMIRALKIADLYLKQIKSLDAEEPRFYNASLLIELTNRFEYHIISRFQELKRMNGIYNGTNPMIYNAYRNFMAWFNIRDERILHELLREPGTVSRPRLLDYFREQGVPSHIAFVLISGMLDVYG